MLRLAARNPSGAKSQSEHPRLPLHAGGVEILCFDTLLPPSHRQADTPSAPAAAKSWTRVHLEERAGISRGSESDPLLSNGTNLEQSVAGD